MSDFAARLLCSPKSRHVVPPVAGSEVRWCSICAQEVWVSPEGLAFMAEPDVSVVCIECAPGLPPADEVMAVPGADPRLAKYLPAARRWLEGQRDA